MTSILRALAAESVLPLRGLVVTSTEENQKLKDIASFLKVAMFAYEVM